MSNRTGSRAPFVLVASCLFLSGAGSLVLEVVWSRLLKLVFGSNTLAISTILVAYMLGLGIGGLLGGRFAARFKNGIRVYAIMELAIAAYAIAVPFVLELYPAANKLLFANLGFWPAAAGRFVLALVVLLLPTVLMGATLPVLVQAVVRRRHELAKGIGLLYGINTLGAVAGVLTATFVLFPLVGVRMTNAIGAGADAAVGLVALFLVAPLLSRIAERDDANVSTRKTNEKRREPGQGSDELTRWNPALLSYGLVGFTALSYEVAWTRALAMVCGSSVYAFATMLAAFLCGIALGSLVGRYFFDRLARPLFVYSVGMASLGLASLVTFLTIRELPDLFLAVVDRFGPEPTSKLLVSSTLLLSFAAMAAPTVILGALFPLLTRGLASRSRPASETVGDVYFVNTIGSAAGAFCAGFLLIPAIGLKWTMLSGIAINLVVGAALLAWQRERTGLVRNGLALATAAVAVAVVVVPPEWRTDKLSAGVFLNQELLYRYDIELEEIAGTPFEETLFYEEGINTTTSVHRNYGHVNMRVNGKIDASVGDMPTQVIMGHAGPLLHGPADDVLVIGYASGVTVGSASLHRPARLDVVEIEPAILEASRYFEHLNHKPLDNPGVNVIVDDARTYFSYTDETYDLIISAPSNPWITGCSNLFTSDFIGQVKERLEPGGVLLQWIQFYGIDREGLGSIFAAVSERFDHVYGLTTNIGKGDLLLIASDDPIDVDDVPAWDAIDVEVRKDLQWAAVYSRADLLSLVTLSDGDVASIAADARHRNSDDSMYVELSAPWQIYESADATRGFLVERASGALPLVAASSAAGDGELLGALAKAYHGLRGLPGIGERALALAPESANGLVTRAELEAKKREGADRRLVLSMLDRAVGLRPDGCLPRLYRGQHYFSAGAAAAAIADLDVALDVCGGDPRVQWGRMRVLLALRRTAEAMDAAREREQAVEWMSEYLSHRPNSPREWSFVADMHRAIGDERAAESALANVERARRNLVRIEHRTALKALAFGEPEAALRRMEWVAERDPDNPRVKSDLAKIRDAAARSTNS